MRIHSISWDLSFFKLTTTGLIRLVFFVRIQMPPFVMSSCAAVLVGLAAGRGMDWSIFVLNGILLLPIQVSPKE